MYASQATRMLFRLKNLHLLPKELATRASNQWLKHGGDIWEGCGYEEGPGVSAWLCNSQQSSEANEELYFGRQALMDGKTLYRFELNQRDLDWTKFTFLRYDGGRYVGPIDRSKWTQVTPDQYEYEYEICPKCLKDIQGGEEDGCKCNPPSEPDY